MRKAGQLTVITLLAVLNGKSYDNLRNEKNMTREVQGFVATSGTGETHTDFRCPKDYWIQSIQIYETQLYPMYVRVEFYYDVSDEMPEILFTGWLRATSGSNNINSIVLNKKVYSEKGILRVCVLNESGVDLNPIAIVNFGLEATSQTDHYIPGVHQGYWAYDDMIERHTSAGVIDIRIVPLQGSWFEIEYIRLVAGMTGAEDIALTLCDENDQIMALLMSDNTQTGTLYGPNQIVHIGTEITTTPSTVGSPNTSIRVHYPDYIRIDVSSCAATDDIKVTLRAKLRDAMPSIVLGANNQSQAGYAAEYSKVI